MKTLPECQRGRACTGDFGKGVLNSKFYSISRRWPVLLRYLNPFCGSRETRDPATYTARMHRHSVTRDRTLTQHARLTTVAIGSQSG